MSPEEEFARLLEKHFSSTRRLTRDQAARLYRHYEILVRWNKVLNLTAIDTLEQAVVRHYCESLFLAVHLPPARHVLDLGSGGGFPGVPLAVLRPETHVTLAESHRRKAVFLREATRAYANVRVAAERAAAIREPFDWVVSRAVRWEEVLPVAPCGVGLLLSACDAAGASREPDFRWGEPLPLPWGRQTLLLLGQRCSTWNISA